MLKDMDFKDIYLGGSVSLLAGVPGTLDPIKAPPECADELRELREICEKQMEEKALEEFAIRHNDTAYRVALLTSVSDKVYVLRRFPKQIPPLESLGFHNTYVEALMQPKLQGLILITGAYGHGKTTTASSIIASRLNKLGGVAITIEDPPEMPLEGTHGEGVCYQTWLQAESSFGAECKRAARWAPSMIFLGEIRDADGAMEALRASINGRLVIATTHSDKVAHGIERLYSLATNGGNSPDDVASLIAGGLLCAIHQTLEGEPRMPKVEFLWIDDAEDSIGIRNSIKSRKFESIQNHIQMQNNMVLIRQHSFVKNAEDRRAYQR
jgi:Tfp pilus assembly pilus retraction ATPase PilT